MISIFPADATDFSSNGLCALAPSSCLVNETLNGEWELQLVHPLDDRDKWSWLQVGSIVKAPVPAAMTPRVKLMQQSEGKDIYRVRTFHGGLLNLWSRATRSSPSLAKYKTGQEVQVISTANPDFFEVIAPDGKRGWMGSEYLVFVRTEITNVTATGQIVAPRQLRDQPFRIYRIVPELTQVTAFARHLSYDLMNNMIYAYKPVMETFMISLLLWLSSCAVMDSRASIISLVLSSVLMCSVSKNTPTGGRMSCRMRTVWMESTTFLAKRATLLQTISSILPRRQSAIMRLNSSRLSSIVPVMPSSA